MDRTLRIISWSVLAAGLASAVAQDAPGQLSRHNLPKCQGKAKDPQPVYPCVMPDDATPEHLRFQLYFLHIANMNQAADEIETQRGDHAGAIAFRTSEQRRAELTEAEGLILTRIAQDETRVDIDYENKLDAVKDAQWAARFKAHDHSHIPMKPTPEFEQLWTDKALALDQHITQLKAELGPEAFKKVRHRLLTFIPPAIVNEPPSTTRKPMPPGVTLPPRNNPVGSR